MTTETAIARVNSEPHAKAFAFLAGALALTEHQTAIRIDLSYAPAGGYRADPLRSWTREGTPEYFAGEDGKPNQVFTERLTAEIFEIAEDHADTYGAGRHRFVVRIHQHMGGRMTHAFAILPSFSGGESADGPVTLEPTSTGLVGQLMRHLENRDRNAQQTLQSFLGAINHHAAQMREENADLRAQLAAKDKERMEWLNTIEAARSTEHARQIEAQIVVGKEERKSYATKKIVNLIPVAISHWMGSGKNKKPKLDKDGKPIAPPPPGPLAQLVGKMIDSFTDAQREQLGAVLSMEQQILFMEVIDVVDNGDSILLGTMLNDLVSTLLPPQIASVMELLDAEQRKMFMQAAKLAAAQASQADAGEKSKKPDADPEHVNGTTTAEPS